MQNGSLCDRAGAKKTERINAARPHQVCSAFNLLVCRNNPATQFLSFIINSDFMTALCRGDGAFKTARSSSDKHPLEP
jgi:hypothetical protein